MLVVSCVPTHVVHVIDMIPVWDCDMPTPVTVNMVMRLMHRAVGWLTFVVVILVLSVKLTVVQVVDMIPVWDCDVTASFAVHISHVRGARCGLCRSSRGPHCAPIRLPPHLRGAPTGRRIIAGVFRWALTSAPDHSGADRRAPTSKSN